jgi:hypothetical protein
MFIHKITNKFPLYGKNKKWNHVGENILVKRVSQLDININALYYHYRNSDKYYQVKAIASSNAIEKHLVIYQALYGKQLTWARSIDVWSELVEYNGILVPRFKQIYEEKN